MRPQILVTRLSSILLAAALAARLALAADVIAPNANLKAEGLPAIPAALAAKLDPYGEFKPASAVDWHPEKRELIVARRAGNVTQLHLVSAPGDEPKQLTTFPDPVRFGAFLAKKPDALVFSRDSKGNEQRQVYRLDSPTATPVLLTDERRKNDIETFTHARDRMLVATTDVDAMGKRDDPNTDLTLLDPLEPAKARKITTLPGTGWGNFSFSFDDKRVAFIQFKSVNETYVWVMDLATSEAKNVLPPVGVAPSGPIATFNVNFARDGKGLFLSTDRDGEFQKLAYFDLGSGKLEYFGAGGDWDVESIVLSPDGHTLAVITNEAGIGVLRLYDADTRRVLPKPPLPVGTVGGAAWHQNSRDLAVTVSSAQSPSDVYAIDTRTNRVERWTETKVPGLDAVSFRGAEPIAWKSFDGRTINGFLTRPPARFSGKRPVIVMIHGGPEGQARPGFLGRWNYFLDELGIAIIQPNVRGSTGYGKTFVALDNGMKREDSVKDIGALLDWIRAQPDLDADRVATEGGSYGGYMVLAVATNFPDRITGTVDIVGVANFVSFLESTESYRRDLRRVEYGDERDPAMRAFLTRISPTNNAQKIKAPLFVVAGLNDPRVRYTEAEQIMAAARKNGVPVWYLLAD
ncbi:MAG TPA: prolyl oligopeptidase family serine peptidase, partial [Casimicrobiaceae bacterium]|nr:prolyl oligopeptidase family serine peptidase [Casimicrobiaceae bacterium]